MPNSLAVSTSPPNKQWAGGYDAGPLKYRFQQLLYFILESTGCWSVVLIVLSANWRPGTIQVFTPNRGRITACSKNHTTNTRITNNSSFIVSPPKYIMPLQLSGLLYIIEYCRLKSKFTGSPGSLSGWASKTRLLPASRQDTGMRREKTRSRQAITEPTNAGSII